MPFLNMTEMTKKNSHYVVNKLVIRSDKCSNMYACLLEMNQYTRQRHIDWFIQCSLCCVDRINSAV